MKKLLCILALLCAVSVQADAQSWKDILTGVVKSAVGDKATNEFSLIGTWEYVAADCQLKGDNILTNLGGEVATAEVEKKMSGIYTKVGLNTLTFTFQSDNTCSYSVNGRVIKGTYEFDAEAKTVTIKGSLFGAKIKANVVILGNNMSFMFDADKILSVVKTITGAASKLNASASTVNSLISQFNGLMVGFEMKKL